MHPNRPPEPPCQHRSDIVPQNGETSKFITIYGILCLHGKEALRMASVRFTDLQSRPTAFLAALRALGDAPARSLTALAQRLGVSEADAATVVTPLAEEPAPVVAVPATASASPLLPMTGRNDGSSAPKTLLNRRRVRAA